MDAVQMDFSGGISAMVDPSKTGQNQYRLGFNVRIRRNVIEGAFRPVKYSSPAATHQALFVNDDDLILMAGGSAYVFDDDLDQFTPIGSFTAMSTTADRIYHCNVPQPTNYLMRDSNGDVVYNSNVSTTPEATVLQDGVNQARLLFSDLSSAIARTFNQWSYTRPEYVPIGLQMAYSGNVLYIIGTDHKKIFQSVTGRPLDFMRNINSATGAAGGDASTTCTAVSGTPLTAIIPGQTGGFIATSFYKTYAGILNPDFPTIFGEVYVQPMELFPVGAVSQYAFTFAGSESVFVSSAGIMSFNQTQQLRWQSNNSPFGAPINDYIVRPITNGATATVDDYTFIAVETIFGSGILVYDTRLSCFVSIDLVGTVKEFAVLNKDGVNRLFYITSADEVYEMPLYSGEKAAFGVYFGEFTAGTPKTQLHPQSLKLGLTDVKASGDVSVRLIVDKQTVQTISAAVTATVPAENMLETTPRAFPLEGERQNQVVSIAFDDEARGYAVGFFVSCSADCRLASVSSGLASLDYDNADQSPATITTTDDRFTFIGNIKPEFEDTGVSSDEIALSTGEQYVLFADVGYGQQTLKNGDRILRVNDSEAKVFRAAANLTFPSDEVIVLQYQSFAASLAQINKAVTRGIFLLPTLGDTSNVAPIWAMATGVSTDIPVYLAVAPNTAQVPTALGLAGLPVYKRVETDYINFYILQLTGSITDETLSTGPLATWLRNVIENETDSGKFRVLVLGVPPYSNVSGEEDTDLRWDFARIGIDLVISTSTCYERFFYDSITYINCGTGTTDNLGTSTAGISAAGRFELAARQSVLFGEFIDVDGVIRDRVSILPRRG